MFACVPRSKSGNIPWRCFLLLSFRPVARETVNQVRLGQSPNVLALPLRSRVNLEVPSERQKVVMIDEKQLQH